ncbi:CoB--CoM heterodisulfide reductase iron-sulfur subunit B family protein [Candidatus Hydrogenedentota bacterium]
MISKSSNGAYAYYPGCSQVVTNRAYDISTRGVAGALGLDLVELEDWNCCGATAYVGIREKQAFVLSARNLAMAEKTGRDLVTACSACYVVLNKTNLYMSRDDELRSDIQGALAKGGMSYGGGVRARHLLDVIVKDQGEDRVRERVKRDLSNLKIASYYGCQIGRPFGEVDDQEFPSSVDTLVGWLGADPHPFAMKAKCCGGLMMTTQPTIGQKLTGKILRAAIERGADGIVTCCPLCQMNLEAYQRQVGATIGFDCHIPILYFTQLMGYAFGLPAEEIALSDSLTPVEAMFTKKVGV